MNDRIDLEPTLFRVGIVPWQDELVQYYIPFDFMNKQLSSFHPFSTYKQIGGVSSIFSEWLPLENSETNEWIFMIQKQHDSTIILASAQVNLTCVCPQLSQWKALIIAKKNWKKRIFSEWHSNSPWKFRTLWMKFHGFKTGTFCDKFCTVPNEFELRSYPIKLLTGVN